MRNIWIVARREYRAFFDTTIAYVVAATILFVVGLFFGLSINLAANPIQPSPPPNMSFIVGIAVFMLVFATPAITMRLISNEMSKGTIELLLTAPARDWEIVIGKWLGAVLFLMTVFAIMLVYPIAMNAMISPSLDTGLVLSGFLALIMVSFVFIAIGLFFSSLFENLVATFISTMGAQLIIWFALRFIGQAASGTWGTVIRYLDINTAFNTMSAGSLELEGILMFLSVTVFFLTLTTFSVESRRWR